MNVLKRFAFARAAWTAAVLMALLFAALGRPAPAFALAPLNDDFNNAIAIVSAPATLTLDETSYNDATVALDDPQASCVGYPYLHSVWYSFTPTSYGNATFDTLGSNFDAVLAIWTGARGNLTQMGCDDDGAGSSQAQVKVNMKPGVTYYIEVMQYRTSTPVAPQNGAAVDPLAVTDYMTLNLSFTQTPNIMAPGKYDDKSTLISYTGGWANTTAAAAFSRSFKLSKVLGNTANFTFDGYQFKIYYTRGLTYGNMQVLIDGAPAAAPYDKIFQNGGTAYQQVYTSPALTDGIHTVQLKDIYRYVTLDAVEIIAAPDLVPPSQITDLAATPADAPNYGKVNLSWTAPGDDGTVGTASSYDVRYSNAPITDLNFSSATQVTTGVPTPKAFGGAETMTVTLTPGLTYYFAVRALDASAPDATPGPTSNSPSATAPFVGVVGAGTYEDDNANWMYSGSWTTTLAALATGGKYHTSSAIGNTATFVFNGTGFTFTYIMTTTGGNADIRVDGVSRKQISMKYLTTRYLLGYTLSGLTPGQHVIQIVHLSGTRIYVDRLVIAP